MHRVANRIRVLYVLRNGKRSIGYVGGKALVGHEVELRKDSTIIQQPLIGCGQSRVRRHAILHRRRKQQWVQRGIGLRQNGKRPCLRRAQLVDTAVVRLLLRRGGNGERENECKANAFHAR